MPNPPNVNRVASRLKNPLVLVVIAAVLAGGVAWVALQYLQGREAAMKAEIAASGQTASVKRVQVAVPVNDAPIGTVLNLDNFVARPVEEDLVYPDTVLAADFESMQGMKLARPVMRGRPLRVTDVQAPEIRDVATVLPAGQRALTIEIDNVNSIAQTLRPNHRIDLYLLTKNEAKGGGTEDIGDKAREQVSLFMQDMVVLATGTEFFDATRSDGPSQDKMVRPGEIEGRERGYDTVTLLVTPQQAARLMMGQKLGSYRVVLRGGHDRDRIAQATLRGADLLGAGAGARPRDAGIEFIVGGKGDKIVSEMAVPPSQESRALQRVQAQFAQAMQASRPASAPAPTPAADRTSVTINAPVTRADQIISERRQQ